MGASQSTHRSTPKDVKTNLLWCLDESVHWEQEASIARLLLSEAAAYKPGQTSITTNRMDDASRARAIDLLKKTAELTLVRIDAILKGGNKKKLKDFAASDPARANLASRTFAAAATENLASNVDSLVVNNPAIFSSTGSHTANQNLSGSSTSMSGAHNANPQFSNSKSYNETAAHKSVEPLSGVTSNTISGGKEATIISGPIDMKGTSTASPPALNATDINSGEAFTPEKLSQQERVELAAKFLFIYSLLTKTTACAQHTYKLNTRFDSLRKALKPKRAEKLDEVTIHSLRESYQRADQSLQISLQNFDRAKAALVWLRNDYELAYATHRCNELLRSAHKLRDTMTYSDDARAAREVESRALDGSSATYREVNMPGGVSGSTAVPTQKDDKFYDPKSENRYSAEIGDVDRLIESLDSRRTSLEHSMQQNERDSMNLAFDYLDSNGRGEITHEQCPQLGDRLWRALDTHAHGTITRSNMLKGMENLSKRIDSLHSQIMDIEHGKGDQHRRIELSQLQQNFRNDRQTLRQLNQFFYQYFVEAVFSDMDGSVRQEKVDITNLQNDIKILERALTSSVDPLSSNQSTAGQSIASGTGAANIVTQHQQVSARAIDAHQQDLVKEDRIIAGPTFTKAQAGVPGASTEKEAYPYGTESRTSSTLPSGMNPNDASVGVVHNSNYVPAQQEPLGQKTYEHTIQQHQQPGQTSRPY